MKFGTLVSLESLRMALCIEIGVLQHSLKVTYLYSFVKVLLCLLRGLSIVCLCGASPVNSHVFDVYLDAFLG